MIFVTHFHIVRSKSFSPSSAKIFASSLSSIVEINVAIIVACSSCFRPFFITTKTFSSSVLHSLRSRLVASSTSDGSSTAESGPIIGEKQETSDEAESWHDRKMIPRSDGHPGEGTKVELGLVTSVGGKTSTESNQAGPRS